MLVLARSVSIVILENTPPWTPTPTFPGVRTPMSCSPGTSILPWVSQTRPERFQEGPCLQLVLFPGELKVPSVLKVPPSWSPSLSPAPSTHQTQRPLRSHASCSMWYSPFSLRRQIHSSCSCFLLEKHLQRRQIEDNLWRRCGCNAKRIRHFQEFQTLYFPQ